MASSTQAKHYPASPEAKRLIRKIFARYRGFEQVAVEEPEICIFAYLTAAEEAFHSEFGDRGDLGIIGNALSATPEIKKLIKRLQDEEDAAELVGSRR